MRTIFDFFLPLHVDNTIRGSKLPFYILLLVTIVGTVRSLTHILSPDGGAGSIAGMDLSVEGASGIIFAFALWGSEQLIFALLQWVVILRYRSLVPLMWVIQLSEIVLRMLVGHIKTVTFAHTPPGAIGNYVILVVATAILALCVFDAFREVKKQEE